jgi:hypothetical protein
MRVFFIELTVLILQTSNRPFIEPQTKEILLELLRRRDSKVKIIRDLGLELKALHHANKYKKHTLARTRRIASVEYQLKKHLATKVYYKSELCFTHYFEYNKAA